MTPRGYDVIVAPLVTEKSTLILESSNMVAFLVAPWATKQQVSRAVEAIFDVKVAKVRVLNRQGKVKRFRGFKGRQKNTRRAYVTLEEGHAIDVGFS